MKSDEKETAFGWSDSNDVYNLSFLPYELEMNFKLTC